jgi:hypothetical protein
MEKIVKCLIDDYRKEQTFALAHSARIVAVGAIKSPSADEVKIILWVLNDAAAPQVPRTFCHIGEGLPTQGWLFQCAGRTAFGAAFIFERIATEP